MVLRWPLRGGLPCDEDALQIRRGACVTSRAAGVLAGRLEVDDSTPPIDRLTVAVLVGGEDALEVQRPDVLRIESQHARERDRGVGAAPAAEQRLT